MDRIKLLYVGDGATHTGFSQVSTGLLTGLHESGRYDITHLAINWLDIGPNDAPWNKVAAGFWQPVNGRFEATDPFGRFRLNQFVQAREWDVIVVNNDFPVAQGYALTDEGELSAMGKSNALKVLYAPLDSQPCPPQFAASAGLYDVNISYTFWQRDLMADLDERFADMPVMYHGIDLDTYQPMDKSEAKERLEEVFARHNNGKAPRLTDKYIVYFVGTNQWRKDLPALFRAYVEFRKKVKNAFLIPHTSAMPSQINGGWQLKNLAALTGVEDAVIMDHASQFSQEEMAVFMNAADVLAYPTRGEGFGIPSLEAMACKTPVVATKFGPQRELHENGRGYFIKVADTVPGEPGCLTYFALPDHKDLARQLYSVYANRDEVAGITERAYEFAQRHPWSDKSAQLDSIITEALAAKRNAASSSAAA